MAALGTPANLGNVGDVEALLPAVPFGDALYFRCVERFSPFGYVLLLVHPGNLETCCGMGLGSALPGSHCALIRLPP
ncbi:hypothetical protein YSY43_48610 [Paenibacillus sp. YSY-4.3]